MCARARGTGRHGLVQSGDRAVGHQWSVLSGSAWSFVRGPASAGAAAQGNQTVVPASTRFFVTSGYGHRHARRARRSAGRRSDLRHDQAGPPRRFVAGRPAPSRRAWPGCCRTSPTTTPARPDSTDAAGWVVRRTVDPRRVVPRLPRTCCRPGRGAAAPGAGGRSGGSRLRGDSSGVDRRGDAVGAPRPGDDAPAHVAAAVPRAVRRRRAAAAPCGRPCTTTRCPPTAGDAPRSRCASPTSTCSGT